MQMMIMIVLFMFSLSLSAEEKVTKPLKEIRDDIKFRALSDDDRSEIIKHARTLFSRIYVNLEHKKKLYGVNPVDQLEVIEKNYKSMSEKAFHSAILMAFNSVRDAHVNYTLPTPYACYSTVLPIDLRKVEKQKVIISAVNVDLKNNFPEISKVSAGDELIEYNNKSLREALHDRSAFVAASTSEGMFNNGILDLVWRSLEANLVPDEDSAVLKLKKHNGEVYKVTLPWLARVQPSCVKEIDEKENLGYKKKHDFKIETMKEKFSYFKKMKSKFLSFMREKLRLQFKREKPLADVERVDLGKLNTTANPELTWKVVSYKGKKFGYLKLAGFTVETGLDFTLNEIRSVLENKMANTSALVIDLRGNYGGAITYAERLSAMLTAKAVKPLPFYVRANDTTAEILRAQPQWKNLVTPYGDSDEIVGPANLTAQKTLANLSQAYFGKVALLTNSDCFSSCDLFSAIMKDNTNVTIYGTDHSTFGGGANVWGFDYINQFLSMGSLPQGVGMRVTARHAHRLSDNSLIEDRGVATDVFISEDAQDAIDTESSSVVARIFSDFAKMPDLEISSKTSLSFDRETIQKHDDENVVLNINTTNLSEVVLHRNGKEVSRYPVRDKKQTAMAMDLSEMDSHNDVLEFYGFNKTKGANPILRKTMGLEFLPAYKKIADFSIADDMVLRNIPEDKHCGWVRTSRNSFVIEEDYCPSSIMEMTAPVEFSEGKHHLSFDLVLNAEPDFDFFEIVVLHNGVEEKIVEPTSMPAMTHANFDLSKYAGKKIDIKIRFITDECGAGEGITISNFELN